MGKTCDATIEKIRTAWFQYVKQFNMHYMFDLADIWTEDKAIAFLELINKSISDNKDYIAEKYGIDVVEFKKPRTIIID